MLSTEDRFTNRPSSPPLSQSPESCPLACTDSAIMLAVSFGALARIPCIYSIYSLHGFFELLRGGWEILAMMMEYCVPLKSVQSKEVGCCSRRINWYGFGQWSMMACLYEEEFLGIHNDFFLHIGTRLFRYS